jgi:hypothetical protein
MSSLSAKDRVSLCSFTFSDGRRCRTPRISSHPHFCFYHAQKEARARTAEMLGKDLAYFFSGDYLSACDLSTALARLIPAVVRGDVKPRTARTVAYLAQTLLQTIHIAQHEYTNAFGSDGWRQSIRGSVNGNHNYRFPPAPKPEHSASPQPQPPPQPVAPSMNCHSERSEEPAFSSNSPLATDHSSLPQSPHTPLPPTSAEFVQHVVAGLQTGSLSATPHVQPAQPIPQSAETPKAPALPPNDPSQTRPSTPASASQPPPTAHSARSSPSHPACHPERSEGSHRIPATQFARAFSPAPQPEIPSPTAPCTSPREPNRDAPWLHFGDSRHIRPDSKLL